MESFFKWVKEDDMSLVWGFFTFMLLIAIILGTRATISTIYGPPDPEKETKRMQTEIQMLEMQIKLAELQGRMKAK